jgi:hypothetical protein
MAHLLENGNSRISRWTSLRIIVQLARFIHLLHEKTQHQQIASDITYKIQSLLKLYKMQALAHEFILRDD